MKNRLPIAFLFILITTLTFNLHSQVLTQTLRGTVIDNTTESPLVGATVQLIGANIMSAASADANGQFTIKDVPVGRQAVEVRYLGYNTLVINNLLVESGRETTITVKLQENAFEMEAVNVVADQKKAGTQNDMVMVSGRTFSKEETERFAGSLGDPARMVANYAGVVAGNDSRNDIIIRGNSPTGLLWRVEGIEVPNPNHFGSLGTTGGPVSMLNNNIITNSDFLTGAFPAEYGNAIAGAFDISLRSGNNQKHEFIGQVGWNGFEAGAEGPLFNTKSGQKASYLIAGRYSTLDVASKIGVDLGTGAAIPKYKDLTCIIDIPGTKLGRFKFLTITGNSKIDLGKTFEIQENDSYSTPGVYIGDEANVLVTGLTHNIMISSKSRIETTISYQETGAKVILDSINYAFKTYDPIFRSSQKEQKVSLSTQWKSKLDSRNNVSIGLIVDKYYTSYLDSILFANYSHFVTSADINGNFALTRGYAELQHNFTEKALGYIGVSSQYLPYNNQVVAEPRLGFQYKPRRNQSFNIGVGLHSQIQPRVAYYYQEFDSVTNTYSSSNKELKMSRSFHAVLGYNYLITPNVRVKAETYYQYLYKIPVKESFGEFSMLNVGDDFSIPREDSLINKGTGTNYGLELTIEKFLSNGYYCLLTTSLYQSKYRGNDGIERNTAFNGNYVVNQLAGYEHKLSQKYTLTFDEKMTFAGGRRKIDFNLEESYKKGETVLDWSNPYENQYDAYFKIDLRFGIRINGKKITQEMALDLQNATNNQGVTGQGLDIKNHKVYEIKQMAILPMMLYRVRF